MILKSISLDHIAFFFMSYEGIFNLPIAQCSLVSQEF